MRVDNRRAQVRRRTAAVLGTAMFGSMMLATTGAAGAAVPDRVAAVGSAAAADTDGDALLDVWETEGYDADGDGDIDVDLPAMGADPMHKDIFVEMDYMGAEATCPCHLPLAPDLKRIEKAYAQSPRAVNPDGTRGITIHLDAGDARGNRYDLGGGNLVAHDDDLNPVNQQFDAIKAANFDPDRARIFHYMIWAHRYGGGTSSGLSFGIGADSFVVTLGAFPEHGTSNAKVGTFIHELGHNLGLRHGGTDDTNYKPNYLSLMSYAFQIDGLPRVGGKPNLFSYSKTELPTLDEVNLREQVGLDDKGARKFKTSWWCPNGLVTSPGTADGPLDWTCNGTISPDPVSADINGDGRSSKLTSARDWGHIVFDGGSVGAGATEPKSAELPVELTYEQYAADQSR